MIKTICTYFFWFMLYSIGGWVMETVLFAVRDRKFVKRGFLFGPICPIYGTAAVILSLLFYGKVENIFLLFLLGFFTCGGIEYITHFLMEKLFHAMWWDYSGRRFNIKGRVYLMGLVGYGIGSVVIVKLIQPLVVKLTDMIPDNILYIICFILYSIALVDISLTLADLKNVVKSLKSIQYYIFSNLQKGIDNTEEAVKKSINNFKESEVFKNFSKSLNSENSLIRRIRRKYPNFTMKNFKHIFEVIFDEPQEGKQRTDIKLYGTPEAVQGLKDEISEEDKTSKETQESTEKTPE